MWAINDDFSDKDEGLYPNMSESEDQDVEEAEEEEWKEIERELFSILHYSYDDNEFPPDNNENKPTVLSLGDPRRIISRPLLRKRKEVGSKTYHCDNCEEVGHLSSECSLSNGELCILCGELGHLRHQCPNIFCFNCNLPGHRSMECTTRKNCKVTCHRCKMFGHTQHDCPDLWRRFHYTTTVGPLIISNCVVNQRIYCFNCGQRGHYGYECMIPPMNAFTFWTYPFVVKYGIGNSLTYAEMNNKRRILSKDPLRRNGNFAVSNSKSYFTNTVPSEPVKPNDTKKRNKPSAKFRRRRKANLRKRKAAAALNKQS